jgi:uncharacterized protein YoxC
MSINPLNNISKVYLEQVATQEVELDEGMTLKDYKKKKSALKQKEKRAAEKTSPLRRAGIHADKASPERAARHRANVDPDYDYGDEEKMYPGGKLKNPKKIRKAKALGELGESSHLEPDMKKRREANEKAIEDMKKTKAHKDMVAAVRKKFDEALDPVGQEDADIDNDGDTDSSDKYLHKRRKTIGKAIAKKKGMKEGFSNWRQDLAEVMTDTEDQKEIKEKKVNNKVKINPTIGEAVEEIGGTLLEMIEIEGVLDELSESELLLLSDQLIEEVVEEFFYECIEEGYEIGEVEEVLCEAIETSFFLLNEAKVTLGHDTKIKSDRLEKVKSAVKKVGKAVARGAGYAAGLARRAGSAAKREFKAGYEKGKGGSSSVTSSTSSDSSSSSDKPKRPGLLSRIGSKLKSGLKKAVARGARAVSRGARNVARKMEGGKRNSEAPKTTSKKAEPVSDPWEGSYKKSSEVKKVAAPKATTKKKKSNLDNLLASIRSEETEIQEAGDWWHPDPKKDRAISGVGNRMRAREDRGQDTSVQTKPDYSRRLKPGETYMQFAKRKEAERMKKEEVNQIDEKITDKTDMGAAIKDFYASKSPQLAGRTKEERRKAAIAAVLTARRGGRKLGEQMDTEAPTSEPVIDKKKEMMDKQKLANMKMLQQKERQLQNQKMLMKKSGKLPLEVD